MSTIAGVPLPNSARYNSALRNSCDVYGVMCMV